MPNPAERQRQATKPGLAVRGTFASPSLASCRRRPLSSNVMPQVDDPHSLLVPLFESLDGIGFAEHGNFRHFNTGTLFWSLTRLFGCYERIMSVTSLPREGRPFLDADIESYIIRFRIVLNDIAYTIWQLLPPNARGMKAPSGGTHPLNKEMSVFSLAESLQKNKATYPELASVFASASIWMNRLKNYRDNVVHYKSKVVVFDSEQPSFAPLNAAGTERRESTTEGGEKLLLEPVADFVNGQMLSLHTFMHADLAAAVKAHASRMNLKSLQAGWYHRITCLGVQRFRTINAIEA